MMKLYQSAGAPGASGMPEGMPDMSGMDMEKMQEMTKGMDMSKMGDMMKGMGMDPNNYPIRQTPDEQILPFGLYFFQATNI